MEVVKVAHKPTYEELEDRIRELEQSEVQLKESMNASAIP